MYGRENISCAYDMCTYIYVDVNENMFLYFSFRKMSFLPFEALNILDNRIILN